MDNNCILTKIEGLKQKIIENVSVNDDVICALCDEMISLGKRSDDLQSVAFGYVWRADYYLYVETDINAVLKELSHAEQYIDEETPSELLEKYYTLKHVCYENTFDMQSAFFYCLEALKVSEELGLQYRISANYGNLASYFMECDFQEGALEYTTKAVNVLRSLLQPKPRLMRLFLINLVTIYLKLGKLELVEPCLEELRCLPVEKKDLQIYVDYGYMLYYAKLKQKEKCLYYLQEMFGDGLLELPNRIFTIELLSNAMEAMISIGNEDKSRELMKYLEDLIRQDEAKPLLILCKLKIYFSQQFETDMELKCHYREYYHLHFKVQSEINQIKRDGFHAKARLNDLDFQYNESKKELKQLHNLANYDELTQVYNRRYLNIRQDELINCKDSKRLGLVLIDIDYFKEYNDFYGHLSGDQVLIKVAECLKENAGEQMEVFRYGGDEFVCLSWGMDNKELESYALQVASAMRNNKIEHAISGCAKQVTLSIGLGSKFIKTKVEAIALFEEVDGALYQVKKDGRNNVKTIGGQDVAKGES